MVKIRPLPEGCPFSAHTVRWVNFIHSVLLTIRFLRRKLGRMINRKKQFAIDRPRHDGRGLMAAYFPVNDPAVSLSMLSAYERAGVDAIELGIKTDDPHADGDIVADSMRRSTGVGSISDAWEAIQRVRSFEHDTLGMIFTYAENKLAPEAELWSGVDALLCLGEGGAVAEQLELDARKHGTRITKFVPYELPELAVVQATKANGFVMLQYTSGKTGLRTVTDDQLPTRLV